MADAVLDTSGLLCPLPVLKAKKAIAALSPGQILEVIATDPGSIADFDVFCAAGGHRLVASHHGAGVFRFEIARGGPR
jgi:tRNA 2-thiouridine synthesizing protein A